MAKPKSIPKHYIKAPSSVAFIKSAPYIVEVPVVSIVQEPEWRLLDWLLSFGKKPTPIPVPPPPPQEIKPDDIRAALGRQPMEDWEPADRLYGAADESMIIAVEREKRVASHKYDENWFDCDDFTAVGRSECKKDKRTRKMSTFDAWVGFPHQGQMMYHSLMAIFSVKNNKLIPLLVENQNYKVQTFPPDWEFWAFYG